MSTSVSYQVEDEKPLIFKFSTFIDEILNFTDPWSVILKNEEPESQRIQNALCESHQ